jgi:hypothetical protein
MIHAANNTSVNGYVTKIAGLINGHFPPSLDNDCRTVSASLMKIGMGMRLYILGLQGDAMHCVVTDDHGHPINDSWGIKRGARLVNGKYYVREGHEHTLFDILYSVPVREFLLKYTHIDPTQPPTRTAIKSGKIVK